MRFRSNRQLEHSEDYLTKKLTEIDSTNDKGARQQHHHQTALFLVDKNTANNQTMSKGGVGISGLNNLGNTCFFNSVLQNLAQTQLLEELLNEILTGPCPSKLSIKHHEDYDSDLTDCDEAEIVAEKTGDLNRTTQNGEDSERSKKSSVTKEAKVHRSIRVKDVDLVVREGPGLLTRRLHETIKNIRSANSNVVNPNNLFTSVCKKVPSFKGYQQQDSHELLRNLLDAVKCEELKRRQTAILESFSIQNPKNIDELTKMKIKRYGRLSSYTVIDNLFGGHLLSSIICQECRSCVVRLEPILDLSLPIVDDDSLEFESNKRDLPGRSCKAKGKANNTPVKPASSPTPLSKEAAAFKKSDPVSPDNSKLSKHQLKKMKKDSKKTKRKDKKGGKGKNDEDEEETTTTTTTATKESTAESQEPTVEENSTIEDKLAKLELNGEEESSNQNEAQHLINNEETSEENSQREMNGGGKEEKSNEEEKPLLNGVNEDNEEEENDEVSQEGQRSLNSLKLEAMKRLGAATAIDEHMTGLEQCLARFTSVEMLSDRITCDRCSSRARTKTYTHATKQYLLGELPAILTIHLKRFQQHGMHLAKSNKYVSFPAMLDMSPYASKICHGVRENQRPIYRLYGVVEHSGRLNSGHYTAYVRVLEDEKDNNNSDETTRQRITRLFLSEHRLCNFNKLLNSSTSTSKTISNKIEAGAEKWFYVSDSHVKEANLAQVLKSQAYLLFYERIQ